MSQGAGFLSCVKELDSCRESRSWILVVSQGAGFLSCGKEQHLYLEKGAGFVLGVVSRNGEHRDDVQTSAIVVIVTPCVSQGGRRLPCASKYTLNLRSSVENSRLKKLTNTLKCNCDTLLQCSTISSLTPCSW